MSRPVVPAALLDPVVAYFHPRRVILFGSQARGDAGRDSDIDLLVVVDDDTPAEKITLEAGVQARRGYDDPADVIPVRDETFRRMAGIPGTLSRAAVLDGVTVYERVPAVMSEPEPGDVRASVATWLRIARADMQVAQACVSMDPAQLGVAAYHCQQAAEKLLKAFLVLAGIDFRRTHDLKALGQDVAKAFPTLRVEIASMREWTGWGLAYRYPDGPDALPDPSGAELAQALTRIGRVAQTLEAELASRFPA